MMGRVRELGMACFLAAGLTGSGGIPFSHAAPSPQGATALGELAASMAPGMWAELTTTNLANALSSADHGGGNASTIVGDANNGAWDPASGQLHFIGSDHNWGVTATKWIRYTESNNAWTVMPDQPWYPFGTNHNFHNQSNMDPARGEFYFREYYTTGGGPKSGTWQRYSIGANTWTATPPLDAGGGTTGYHGSCAYFREMDGLVQWIQDWSADIGTVFLYKRTTNAWQRLGPASGFDTAGAAGLASATYNPVHKLVWLTGGNNRRNWKLTSDGAVTELPQAPVQLGYINRGTVTTVDPVSGDFLIFSGDGKFTSFNIQTGTYTLESDCTAPVQTCPSPASPAAGTMWCVFATPIANHGVTMFVKLDAFVPKVFLYRHAAGSGPSPPAPPPAPPPTPPPGGSGPTPGSGGGDKSDGCGCGSIGAWPSAGGAWLGAALAAGLVLLRKRR